MTNMIVADILTVVLEYMAERIQIQKHGRLSFGLWPSKTKIHIIGATICCAVVQ